MRARGFPLDRFSAGRGRLTPSSSKSLLQARPVYHRTDEAIRGHVFCSFLGLILRKELTDRREKAGRCLQWDNVIRDLDRLEEIEVESEGKRLLLRTDACGVSRIVCRTAGFALPSNVRRMEGRSVLLPRQETSVFLPLSCGSLSGTSLS